MAIQNATAALDLAPTDWDYAALWNRSWSNLSIGRNVDAVEDATALIEGWTDVSGWIYANRGWALFRLGRLDESEDDARIAIEMTANDNELGEDMELLLSEIEAER